MLSSGRLWQAVVLATTMLCALGCYLGVEYWRGGSASIITQTAWDRHIPFHPEWVWVYLFPYVLAPFLAMCISWQTLVWYLKRAIPLMLVSLLIFISLPTRTVRPTADFTEDGATAHLYHNMVAIDGPAANAAPSLHVSLTALLAWALCREWRHPWAIAAIVVATALVWLSTLLTWQHHVIDVASGALLGSAFAFPWAITTAER